MSILSPQQEAARILTHYFSQLARRAGATWTDANHHDMERVAELLGQAGDLTDTIPPYESPTAPQPRQIESRVTQVLERSPADSDPQYTAWKQRRRRAESEDDEVVLDRMLRNGRRE